MNRSKLKIINSLLGRRWKMGHNPLIDCTPSPKIMLEVPTKLGCLNVPYLLKNKQKILEFVQDPIVQIAID
jgi:hypothetical protein